VVSVLPRSDKPLVSRRRAAKQCKNKAPAVLIIVQNLPVPFDRRVWLECQALRSAGYDVAVICPKGPGDPAESTVDGIQLFKYRSHAGGNGTISFVVEYLTSFLATVWLTAKAWHRRRFDVLQACNPPDIFWPIAMVLRPFGVRFVFDHHDLCPELFESRFTSGRRSLRQLLLWLERATFRAADHVISTNESYRRVALTRGGRHEDRVTVVRTGPDPERLRSADPDPTWRRGRKHLVAYLGVMGPQDGVDLAVRCAEHIVRTQGRDDVAFVFVGGGDCLDELVDLRDELDLGDVVSFTGRVPDDVVGSILSTADVGLCPDPKNPLNDVSTMNKTMEYMSYSVPVVAFDLIETRVSAGEAALYATPNSVSKLAAAVVDLLDDAERRRTMGEYGRQRVVEELAWPHQAQRYVRVFDTLTTGTPRPDSGI
jgi:glycosyltransferase involved in cell wall biosynthesis